MDALGSGRIALDTAVFIYFIEEHSSCLPVIAPMFAEAAAGRGEIVTSALTLLEVLLSAYAEVFWTLRTRPVGEQQPA